MAGLRMGPEDGELFDTDEYLEKDNSRSEDDFWEYVDAEYDRQIRLLADPECCSQPWTTASKAELLKVLRPYMKWGYVPDECRIALESVRAVFIENAVKIKFNTIMCGHIREEPAEIADQHDIEWTEELSNKLGDWCLFDDWYGSWRISDSWDEHLLRDARWLYCAADDKEKVQLINCMLQYVHPRGDLSSWFVEGGARVLDEIQNN